MKSSNTYFQSILFLEDSPASRGPLPGSPEAIQMTVISGRKCLELSKLLNPDSFSEKMLRGLLTMKWASRERFLTWKVKATKYGPLIYQLAPSAPRMSGNESGLWRTPGATDGEGGIMEMREGTTGRYKLRDQVQEKNKEFWPTPRANKVTGKDRGDFSPSLHNAVKMWPTPDCSDRRSMKSKQQGLSNMVKMFPTPTRTMYKGSSEGSMVRNSGKPRDNDTLDFAIEKGKGALNAAWVRWLMGFPLRGEKKETGLDGHWNIEPDIPRTIQRKPGKRYPSRIQELKQLGNAAIPQIPEIFGRAIMEIEANL